MSEFDLMIGNAPETPQFLENKVCIVCGQPYNKSKQVEQLKQFIKSSLFSLLDEVENRLPTKNEEPWRHPDVETGKIQLGENNYRQQVLTILSNLRKEIN